MLILIQTLVFLNFQPKIHFFAKFAKKVKVVCFARKLSDMVSRGCWFLFEHSFFEVPTKNSFLGKFRPNISKLSVLPEKWHTWYLENVNSYFNISFLNFQSKIHFWANWGQKSQSCLFCLKIGTHGISRMLILISALAFWISKPKSIFGQNLAQEVELLVSSNLVTQHIWRVVICFFKCW